MSRALIVTVRNASLLPRRLEHVYCAYSKTSCISWLQIGYIFYRYSQKIKFPHAYQKPFENRQWSLFEKGSENIC